MMFANVHVHALPAVVEHPGCCATVDRRIGEVQDGVVTRIGDIEPLRAVVIALSVDRSVEVYP